MKELRNAKGLSQLQMQLLTGINQSDDSKIENGTRTLSFSQCKHIALALDASMDDLAGLTDQPEPYPRAKQ